MRTLSLFSLSLPIALASVAACTSRGEDAAPVPTVAAEAPAPQASPVKAKRTVEVRNPFGNTQVADNLMADGDFELTGRYDQQPWLAFGAQGRSVLNFDTGGHCRSGVRCLSLAPGDTVVGWFATPKQGKVTVSLWAKPIGGSGCKELTVHVVDLDDAKNVTTQIPPPGAPDDSGQCHFEGAVPSAPGGSPAVYLEVADRSKVTSIVVDEVVALPIVAGAQQAQSFQRHEDRAPARLAMIVDWIKKSRRFGLPPITNPDYPAPTKKERDRER